MKYDVRLDGRDRICHCQAISNINADISHTICKSSSLKVRRIAFCWQCNARYIFSKPLEPSGEPRLFETGVPGDEDGFTRIE